MTESKEDQTTEKKESPAVSQDSPSMPSSPDKFSPQLNAADNSPSTKEKARDLKALIKAHKQLLDDLHNNVLK